MSGDAQQLRLRPLSIVDDGDDVLVSELTTGKVVALPPLGGVVLRSLQRGATMAEAAVDAASFAGRPVDVAAFVETIRRLGFVEEDGVAPAMVPSAPVQNRRWLSGPRAAHVSPLFGRPAWFVYGAALAFDIGCLVLLPDLRPRPRDALMVGDTGLAMVLIMVFATAGALVHETWHWLAARARGLSVRFGIDRRLYFVVFETDLSRLWTLPRRQRFGPLLAGLAVDSVVLAGLLGVQYAELTGLIDGPDPALRLLAALAYVYVANMLWQCMVFLRTDLYAVLVMATGCRNLWRVKTLLLRRAVGRLTAEQAKELAAASERDIQVGRWFRWLWVVGVALALGWFVIFVVPVLLAFAVWCVTGLAAGPGASDFWFAAIGVALAGWPLIVLLMAAVRRSSDRPPAGADVR